MTRLDDHFWTSANRQGANADQLLIVRETVSLAQSGSMVRKGEMYRRDIAPLGLPRGRNACVSEGGQQSAPLLG